ncbi:amidohydrolase family protein [Flammeovirga sp. MY04]|uniref:amidohydrolase family protein n=1 Tax=Flammeovirga sp. MY04 TaxID=1191459 RepID=UPI0008063604|nr:amidohydrolase family protein [Flammeovirga sp. MY04]ANQ50697.1 amidohydrolase family protein [Flammeovirga sp. MY04]
MKTLNKIIAINFVLWMISGLAFGQVPTPAKPQSSPILIKGATLHDGKGKVIENSVVAFSDGKITYVGDNFSEEGYQVINATGKHIYPGAILPTSQLGLVEIEAVSASRDDYETSYVNTEVRSVVAYNTDSHVIPTVRSNGILIEQVIPAGGVFSGRSSIVQLDAWNWEEAIIKENDGQYLNWPSKYRQPSWTSPDKGVKPNKKYAERVKFIRQVLMDGLAYSQAEKQEVPNFPLEALKGIFTGDETLFIRVNDAKSIIEAIKLGQEFKVKKMVVVGGDDAWIVADFLKSNNIPVLLSDVHSLPNLEHDDVDLPFKRAQLLNEAGVKVGLTHSSVSNARNLPFYAGTCVAYGVDKEDALKMITSYTAEILGIDQNYGSLEKGKSATLIITKGDFLDMRNSVVEHAFIDGRKIDLNDKHKMLYEKFRGKYEN